MEAHDHNEAFFGCKAYMYMDDIPTQKIVKVSRVFRQQGFITDSKDVRYHPTQKPSELVAQLIEMFSEEGQLIFDPFIGSGTTAIAAIRTGRKYIGCEINEEFCQICEERIKQEETQWRT